MKNKYVMKANRLWLALVWLLSGALSTQAQTVQPPVIDWQRVVEANSPIDFNSPEFSRPTIVRNSQGGYSVLTADRRLLFLTSSGTIVTDTPITRVFTNVGPTSPPFSTAGLAPTTDGGVVLGVKDNLDWSLQRRDANGTLVWVTRTTARNTPNVFYLLTSIVASLDGGFVAFGTSGPQRRNGTNSVFAEKFDRNGVSVWSREIRFDNRGDTFINQAIATPNGDYLLVGGTTSFPNFDMPRAWAAKLDGQGNTIWQKQYDERRSLDDVVLNPYYNGSFIASGVNNLNATVTNTLNIGPDGDPGGGYYQPGRVGGTSSALVAVPARNGQPPYHTFLDNANQNAGDFRLTNAAQNDQPVWDKTLGGSGNDVPRDIILTDDGGYIVVGTTTSMDGDVRGKSNTNPATWIVKLKNAAPANAFTLLQPTYNCQTGAITFNTSGGDGSAITYNAPGISRSSATSNSGTVEPGLRNDPKPITITATQNAQTASYVFDLKASCTVGGNPLAPALITSIPDFTFTVGEGVNERVDQYFNRDPQGNFRYTAGGLPPGLLFFEIPSTGEVRLYSTPTATGVYTVTVTVTNPKIPSPNNSTSTTFKITVVDKPVVNPPTPPAGGTLALTQPTYNCQTGAITFNTSGGDGSTITYNAPGISRTSLTSNSGTVEPGLRNDPKPITITATQNGNTVSFTFDLKAFCSGTQPPVDPPTPPVNPPTGGTLTLLAPTYDCATGALTFRTSGGDGSVIEYAAAGITGWTTNPNQFVDKDSRTASDVKPFMLMARQNGAMVSYNWELKAACGRSQARVGTGERVAELSVVVLGNPVRDAATVEVRGAEGKPLTLRLLDLRGRLVESRLVEQAGAVERQRFDVSQAGSGLLLLRVSSDTQSRTVKIVKQ